MKIWKESPDRPGYSVSTDGEVRSDRTGRILVGSKAGDGYRKICFAGKPHMYIHHMVLNAYVGPAPAGMQCRHLNGDKTDNRLDNLAWGTPTQNSADKALHGTVGYGEKNPMAKLTWGDVYGIREDRKRLGLSYKSLGEKYGVSTMTAFRAVKGESWRT